MTSVVVARIASATGMPVGERRLLVDELRRRAADLHRERRVDGAHRLDRVLRGLRRAACPARRRRSATARRRRPAPARRARPGSRRAAARTRAPRPRPTRARVAATSIGDVRLGGNSVRSASSTTRAECDGAEHARVDAGELDLRERQPERDQQQRGRRGDRARPAHHPARQPVPEAGLARAPASRCDRRAPARRRERVDARAERGEQRRQDRQRRPSPRRASRGSRRRPSSTGSAAGTRAARRAPRRRSRR